MSNKIISLWFCLMLAGAAVQAQDPRFSQYFASPMTLNPALTGNIDGSLRVAMNFRQQWWAASSPFQTTSLSFEHRLFMNSLGEYDRFGVGGMVMTDNSMSGALKSTYASLSTAFHKGLGEQHRLGIGFQGTYGNRVLDLNKISFYNQFDADGFNTNLPSGESGLSAMKPTLGLQTGLMYTYEDALMRVYGGFSMYHINQPRQTVMDDSTSRLPRRYTVHAGMVLLSGEALRITAHTLWQQQAKASEFSIGGAVGYDIGETQTFYAGAWYRLKESVYPYVSYVRNGIQVALTYDMQVSTMRQALPKNGSVELSFIYSKPDNRFEKRAMPWNY
jgi:type IX secretion system PorP/SprF family membrane protein